MFGALETLGCDNDMNVPLCQPLGEICDIGVYVDDFGEYSKGAIWNEKAQTYVAGAIAIENDGD